MDSSIVVFPASEDIQTYLIPATGGYLIEACGAQAPTADGSGLKGDRVKGMFYLNRGDVLKIVVGRQHVGEPAEPRRLIGGGRGGSVVWRGTCESPLPAKLLLAANGGMRDGADYHPPGTTPALGSYNAGAFQSNAFGEQVGDGSVTLVCVAPGPEPVTRPSTNAYRPAPAAVRPKVPLISYKFLPISGL